MSISVVVFTLNSEEVIAATLERAKLVSDDVHVVDDFSSDRTVEIAKQHGANVVQHAFENYAAQRNWAIDNLPLKREWELHLDADERLSDDLVAELNRLQTDPPSGIDGYYIPRLVRFLGRPIRHGGMFPISHLRLFRRGKGRWEDRQYDQHTYVDGTAGELQGVVLDDTGMTLSEWTSRHNRWSDAEVREILYGGETGQIKADIFGSSVQKKRFFKAFYYRLPLFLRPFLLFAYRYLFRRGFLDGREGLIFFVLQTFWFRFLVDAKLFEARWRERQKG